MTFCSSDSASDFVYTSCPRDCVTSNAPFWNAASIDFAKKSSGYAKIVLNGTRSIGAISNTSTFFKHELPNLNSTNVKELTVFLLHNPSQAKYETCKQPKTLKILEKALSEMNISYLCEDNPDEILFLMCFYDPYSKECQAIKSLISSGNILGTRISKLIWFLMLKYLIFYN